RHPPPRRLLAAGQLRQRDREVQAHLLGRLHVPQRGHDEAADRERHPVGDGGGKGWAWVAGAMTLNDALTELRRCNEPVPKPPRVPTDAEVQSAEIRLGIKFHPDYRRFLMEASDVVYGVLEPATITVPAAHNDLFHVTQTAWDKWDVPRKLLPICED